MNRDTAHLEPMDKLNSLLAELSENFEEPMNAARRLYGNAHAPLRLLELAKQLNDQVVDIEEVTNVVTQLLPNDDGELNPAVATLQALLALQYRHSATLCDAVGLILVVLQPQTTTATTPTPLRQASEK